MSVTTAHDKTRKILLWNQASERAYLRDANRESESSSDFEPVTTTFPDAKIKAVGDGLKVEPAVKIHGAGK